MSIKILTTNLDYNAGQAELDAQIGRINTLIDGRVINNLKEDSEVLCIFYEERSPPKQMFIEAKNIETDSQIDRDILDAMETDLVGRDPVDMIFIGGGDSRTIIYTYTL
jgi:hypothetical protein